MKIILSILTFVLTISMAFGAMAFDPEGNIAKAYTSREFNSIMENYAGVQLEDFSVAPVGYLDYKEGKVAFNDTVVAWRPVQYHRIFTAYGLKLNKQEVLWKLGYTTYCKVSDDGQVMFANGNYAYTEYELTKILSLYYYPEPLAAAPPPDSDGDGVTDDLDMCPNTPIGAKVNQEGCWVINNKALFAFDSDIINAEFLPMIDEIAAVLKNNPSIILELQGHTDSKGSAAYNEKLSYRRANAIKAVLVRRNGIYDTRIDVVGFGETKPIADNSTAEGRALNRRVELVPYW